MANAPIRAPAMVTSSATKDRARHEFDAWAASYDRSILQWMLFRPSLQLLLREFIRRWIDGLKLPLDVLDVGCGTGQFCAAICATGKTRRVVGLDYAFSMLTQARGQLDRLSRASQSRRTQSPGARRPPAPVGMDVPRETTEPPASSLEAADEVLLFVHGDAEHLPFADASFDLVTCANSFHHYPHQDRAIAEFRRVLRPGGRLVLIDGFRDSLIGWLVFDVCVSTFEGGVHHCDHHSVALMMEAVGMTVIQQHKDGLWCPILLTVGEVPA